MPGSVRKKSSGGSKKSSSVKTGLVMPGMKNPLTPAQLKIIREELLRESKGKKTK